MGQTMNLLRDVGHRRGVQWALKNWALDPITCTAIIGGQMNGYRTTHPQGSTYLRETNDPAVLAAMIVFECDRFGITALDFPYGARATISHSLPENAVIIYHSNINGGSLDIYPENSRNSRLVALPKAREILAELLQTPSLDQCKYCNAIVEKSPVFPTGYDYYCKCRNGETSLAMSHFDIAEKARKVLRCEA